MDGEFNVVVGFYIFASRIVVTLVKPLGDDR